MDPQQINLQLLAARVAKLEASNRRWKAATIVNPSVLHFITFAQPVAAAQHQRN